MKMNRVTMWSFHVLLGLLVITGINSPSWSTEAFNIETKHFTSYHERPGSMFGFSVAEYRDKQSQGWVIVGAPQAQTPVDGVIKGGAVYRCHVAIDDNCSMMPFDDKRHNLADDPGNDGHHIQIDNKTMQWFGATVSTTQRDGGPILACAPRYVFFGVAKGRNVMNPLDTKENPTKELAFGNQRDPVGTCWLDNEPSLHGHDISSVREFSPCRTKNYGFHKQGSCMAGFSAALSKNGEKLFVGAPGSWYWQGQIYSIPKGELGRKFPYVPPHQRSFGEAAGQIYAQENSGPVKHTRQAHKSQDDSYMGYSMTTGDFSGTGDVGTAVGKPRGDDLRGMVILYYGNLTVIQNITGEENVMGSYFGYTLAAGDIDGDGLDDLIVGAPMFTVLNNPKMYFETGRIYVYYGKGPNKYSKFCSRDGEYNRGRFGLSLAYLGDIDRDGYGDLAVGAPYGGPEDRGAVYIYQGSAGGLLEEYSQVIYGQSVDFNVKTFGFSIAGGLDLDQNSYPDMIVGAYETNTAMFFRSRPVIKMVPHQTYVRIGIGNSKIISLDDKKCRLDDGTSVTCLDMKTCFTYDGDTVRSRYTFDVKYVLDVKKSKNPRLCFIEHEGEHVLKITVEAFKNQQRCHTRRIYVVPNLRDKLTSLDAEMQLSLTEDAWADKQPRNASLVLRPVLARTSSRKDSVTIQKNCGSDDICTPDLQLDCKTNVDRFLMGSGKRIIFNVTVQNANEDAFEAMYYLTLPQGINYVNIERIDKSEIPVQCSPPNESNNNTLKCDIGNPLPRNNLVKFNVILEPDTDKYNEKYHEKSKYEFHMRTNSSNQELASTTHDNTRNIDVDIWVKTELVIEGESKPKEVYYNPDDYTSTNVTKESEYGPALLHNYTIRNRGPSRIEAAIIYLVWPIKTLAGDDFFYLLEQPETSSNVNCDTANYNAASLQLEQKVRAWQEPRPSFPKADENSFVNEGPTRGGNSRGSYDVGGKVVHQETNSTYEVTRDSNGTLIGTADDWTNEGGVVHSRNVTTSVTVDIEKEIYGEERRHEEEMTTYEKRRKEEEDAKRFQPNQFTYGMQKNFESNGGSASHGGSSHVIGYTGGTSVDATGIRTKDRISGDREETIRGSDFINQTQNVTVSQDLERILNTLTKASRENYIYNRGGGRHLHFTGRVGVSDDGKEYIEFQGGRIFYLENPYGGQSYATDEANFKLDSFHEVDGLIKIQDGRAFVQLEDGRRFPLQGSYTYVQETYYSREGGSGKQGGTSFTSGNRGTTDSYSGYSSRGSLDSQRGFGQEVETHSTRTHEERRTYESESGSRVYGREEDIQDPNDVVPSQYRSGFHRRGSRYRREGDVISVDDFRKYEKLHRLQKRNAYERYSDDESEQLNNNLPAPCKGVHCVHLECTVGRLEKDEEVWISARYRVKGSTLEKIVRQEDLRVSTHLVSKVTKVPYTGTPSKDIINNQEIYTIMKPHARTPEPEPVPLWIVVLSACAGVIILLLLIFLLYKCGFFNRNRPMDGPERQPLNRNGHQGDDNF